MTSFAESCAAALNSGWTRRVNLNSKTTTSFLIMCVYLQIVRDAAACVRCFFTFSLDSSIIEWRLFRKELWRPAIYTQYIIPPIAVVHVDAFLCGPQAVFVASHANYDPAHLAINERVPLSFEFNTTARALTTTTLPAVIIIFFRQNHAARW